MTINAQTNFTPLVVSNAVKAVKAEGPLTLTNNDTDKTISIALDKTNLANDFWTKQAGEQFFYAKEPLQKAWGYNSVTGNIDWMMRINPNGEMTLNDLTINSGVPTRSIQI